jgi:hypothetical protein
VEEVPYSRTPQCSGVLRYKLAIRGDGYTAKCQPNSDSGRACGSEFWWDARGEEWRPYLRR